MNCQMNYQMKGIFTMACDKSHFHVLKINNYFFNAIFSLNFNVKGQNYLIIQGFMEEFLLGFASLFSF